MNAMKVHRSIFILLLTIVEARILDWRGPNHKITCNDVIRNFQKRKRLWNKDIVVQRYRRSI